MITVDLEIDGASAQVLREHAYRLQRGARASALAVLHAELQNHLREHSVVGVVVKASAASQRAVKLGHFHSAEVRGVALAAAAVCERVCEANIGVLSRTFGNRKVQEYLEDDAWWAERALNQLKKGSREAAFLVLSCSSVGG